MQWLLMGFGITMVVLFFLNFFFLFYNVQFLIPSSRGPRGGYSLLGMSSVVQNLSLHSKGSASSWTLHDHHSRLRKKRQDEERNEPGTRANVPLNRNIGEKYWSSTRTPCSPLHRSTDFGNSRNMVQQKGYCQNGGKVDATIPSRVLYLALERCFNRPFGR